jgi:hypothetical protein
MTTPLNILPTDLRSRDHGSTTDRSLIDHTVATMIREDLGPVLCLDTNAKTERSMALGERITNYLVGTLRSRWRSQHARPGALPYDDEKLPAERRREIAGQIHSLLGSAFAELVSEGNAGRETVWAVMLTDIVLNEIGQDILDSPVAYAADIARAVDRVTVYLRETVAARHTSGGDDLPQASPDILHLIVQEACSYYLVKEEPDQSAQKCSFQVLEVTEDRIAALPREVAAFVREKSHAGSKPGIHIVVLLVAEKINRIGPERSRLWHSQNACSRLSHCFRKRSMRCVLIC